MGALLVASGASCAPLLPSLLRVFRERNPNAL